MTTSTHTTPTGRTVTLVDRQGVCRELIDVDALAAGRDGAHCDRPSVLVTCSPGAGRRLASACYCDDHGGPERSRRQVLAHWSVVAPDSVGDDEDVQDAGCLALDSRHVFLVIRPQDGRWIAARGIGGLTEPLRRPDADPERTRRSKPPGGGRTRRGGGGSWETREAALEDGIALWRAGVEDRVAEIVAARGGSLAWGVPVEPRTEPIVLWPEKGQSAYAADRVRRLRELLPEAVVDRVELDPVATARGGTRIAVGRHEVLVDDADCVEVDGENWSVRSIAEIVAHVRGEVSKP